MKNNSKNQNQQSPAEPKFTHVRRCHVCGHVNESDHSAVHKCDGCGKYLAPFYYFDESQLDGLKENGFYLSLWKSIHAYHPIWGLSTYWDDGNLVPDENLN